MQDIRSSKHSAVNNCSAQVIGFQILEAKRQLMPDSIIPFAKVIES